MNNTLIIRREPFPTNESDRPKLSLLLDVVYALVVSDPSLDLQENQQGNQYGTLIYKNHPDASVRKNCGTIFLCSEDGLKIVNPDRVMVLKAIDIAKKIRCHVVDDEGQFHTLDAEGNLIISRETESYVIGDKGKRYPVSSNGTLLDPTQMADYRLENHYSLIQKTEKAIPELAKNSEKKEPQGELIHGVGARKGAEFIETHNKKNKGESFKFYTWYQSFLTGFNFKFEKSPQHLLNYEVNDQILSEDMAFLYAHCSRYPEESFMKACLALRAMRMARR
ncbi:hypothetical protein [Acetobacter cibinongensis]|uniref:Uncharacterized protein n=1 Tax=Acetobacter cibinongensis TaxID=146475 RepID=A0A1Z5YTZ4_9PROT|nr:hypothetical protein [Acetobacter cibinongensis]OUJ01979.1 hypothetical protein HK14_07270 [Acetobacter cibinongensis]